MTVIEGLLLLYFASLAPFAVFGVHRLDLLIRLLLTRSRSETRASFAEWPRVTVQLPIFNEGNVVARLVESIGRLDYPRDRLEIQILDDSTDDTTHIIRGARARLPRDLVVHHVRRSERAGFKAGALAHGLRTATGEFVAMFDADFVPSPDFLRRALPPLADPEVGMVQCRWGFLNAEYSVLTGAQSCLLNAHFGVEHEALHRTGSFFNFNGTAGIWRARTIEDAGGWTFDSLTEDLDLSYRAQLRGWRFVYLDDVVAPSELPVDVRAFRTQQYRWSRGMTQVATRLLPRIWRASLPLRTKVDATFHLLSNVGFVFVCIMSLVIIPAAWWGSEYLRSHLWTRVLSGFFLVTNFGVIGAFLLVGQLREKPPGARPLLRWLTMFPVGVALAVTGARGVFDGFRRGRSPFLRTAKHDVVGRDRRGPRVYRNAWTPDVLLEASFAIYHLCWFIAILRAGRADLLLFSSVFMPGYAYFLILELWDGWRGSITPIPPASADIGEKRVPTLELASVAMRTPVTPRVKI